MEIYIALLRGINVSGQKIIKMDLLKSIFESMDFQNVRTYIQSGNVVFEADKEDAASIRVKVENKLKEQLGYDVTVMIRTLDELEEVIRANPFAGRESVENEKLYISFLSEKPSSEVIDVLMTYKSDVDEYRILNREVYILCRGSYGKSLFSNTFLEKKLKLPATTRNWQTVNKLAGMGRG